ncbi:MAG: hypothetical protein ACLQVM_01565 [Terriglobia bacterium]
MSPCLTGVPNSTAFSTTRGMDQALGLTATSDILADSKTPVRVTSTLNGPFSTLTIVGAAMLDLSADGSSFNFAAGFSGGFSWTGAVERPVAITTKLAKTNNKTANHVLGAPFIEYLFPVPRNVIPDPRMA